MAVSTLPQKLNELNNAMQSMGVSPTNLVRSHFKIDDLTANINRFKTEIIQLNNTIQKFKYETEKSITQLTFEDSYTFSKLLDKIDQSTVKIEDFNSVLSEITAIKDDLHDLRIETENIQYGLDCRTAVLEMEIDELRPALDAKTENPNQKSDLEIFNQILGNNYFLNFGGNNIFLN